MLLKICMAKEVHLFGSGAGRADGSRNWLASCWKGSDFMEGGGGGWVLRALGFESLGAKEALRGTLSAW